MDYQEFKTYLMKELQDFYGEDTIIVAERILKNNGQHYDGLQISKRAANGAIPIINIEDIYEEYNNSDMDMENCVKLIFDFITRHSNIEDVLQFAQKLEDWESIKENIYPILLSAEDNRELLQSLVSVPMLDLSISYIIRGDKETCVKIKWELIKSYGINSQELHSQAVKNMKKDGYSFQDMEDLLIESLAEMESEKTSLLPGEFHPGKMYVLTNTSKFYGAAGILDKELVKKFAGNRNFFILPSSIHETIFMLDDGECDGRELNKMVAEINESTVAQEEKLSDHCYYYDAQRDVIRKWD